MHTCPSYGKVRACYVKIGDLLSEAGYAQEALQLAYEPALAVCDQHLTGVDARKKRVSTLVKIAHSQWMYVK